MQEKEAFCLPNSTEVNRFVLDEFKTNNTQQEENLVVKLFAQKYNPQSKLRRIYKIICRFHIRNSIQALSAIGLLNESDSVSGEYYLSNLAKEIFSPPHKPDKDCDKLLEWTYAVGDKQYFLYSWNDAKVSGLLTVDAALMAGILFVLQLLDSANNLTLTLIPLVFYAFSFVILAISIIFSLIHTIPRLNSKMGNRHNLKTMIGINRFVLMQKMFGGKKYFRAEKYYFDCVKESNVDDLLEMNIFQILGMNTNNIRSHALIRKGVWATVISIGLLILATIIFSIQNIQF